ncbi:hypothetical protein [Reyranella sp.]|uniref:hypothetical protein n=1 Tax=Reyranella sp. TaxID=1929291 RepID=UPI003BACC654
MKLVLAVVLAALALPVPSFAQIPPEWQAAAQAVVGELEQGTPRAEKPWTGETNQGWYLARSWRQRNNGNVEITLNEYLTFVSLCRSGCPEKTIEGKSYATMASRVKALRAEQGGPYALAANAHAWLAGLADPTGAAARNALLWSRDLDVPAADFATGNLYALAWLLARDRPTPAEQADTFSRYALLVQEKGWIGSRCLDISEVATVLDAPPLIKACQ